VVDLFEETFSLDVLSYLNPSMQWILKPEFEVDIPVLGFRLCTQNPEFEFIHVLNSSVISAIFFGVAF